MPWATAAGKVEPLTRRPERKYLFALGQSFEQMILRLVGGALTSIHAEHALELALAEVADCAAHAQVNVKGAAVRPERISRFVFCRHGESLPGHARAVEWGSSELLQKPTANPDHDEHGFGIADRLVAGTVRAFAGRLAAPWDQRVVVGHALEAFALHGR